MINFMLCTFFHNSKKCKIALKKVGSKREKIHIREQKGISRDARGVPGPVVGGEGNQRTLSGRMRLQGDVSEESKKMNTETLSDVSDLIERNLIALLERDQWCVCI